MSFGSRVFNFFLDEDKALNGLGGGNPNQTISGTCGRALAAHKWWAPYAVAVINTIFFWQPNHCQNAAAAEAKA